MWEEDEFWIELSWQIDKDGDLGIRKHFLSPYRDNEKINIDEYYQYIFEHTEGLAETAEKEGMTPLEYMRKYGAFLVDDNIYKNNEDPINHLEITVKPNGQVIKDDNIVGIEVNGEKYKGFKHHLRGRRFFHRPWLTLDIQNMPHLDIGSKVMRTHR